MQSNLYRYIKFVFFQIVSVMLKTRFSPCWDEQKKPEVVHQEVLSGWTSEWMLRPTNYPQNGLEMWDYQTCRSDREVDSLSTREPVHWNKYRKDALAARWEGGGGRRRSEVLWQENKKRGCVCLMPEQSTLQVFYMRGTNGWKKRPERRARMGTRKWNRRGGRDASWRWSGTLNIEVKAGRSRPRVEWSSPGRGRASFLGVHGQLEPLQKENGGEKKNLTVAVS